MLNNARNGSVSVGSADMDYISFGAGSKSLVMIPGLGDGLRTVKGMAVPFSMMYSKLARRFSVYVFSRRNELPEGCSTKEMAADIHSAMQQLCIGSASVVGVSQGGMIAQHLAIDHPESVEKLVLVVTMARQNETVQSVVGGWIEMALHGDAKSIYIDTSERSYSEKYLKKVRPMYSLLGGFMKPKSFDRFLVMANSCLTHDAYDKLSGISCPTLVIGGKEDRIVTGQASEELAEKIVNSKLIMYDGLGHGLYEEAGDFLDRVMEFLR